MARRRGRGEARRASGRAAAVADGGGERMLTGLDDDWDFGDLFGGESSRALLDEITARARPSVAPPLIQFTLDADDDQRRFIDSEATTIRLLAPAGSGKTQSIANRIIRRVAQGVPISQFLV